MKRQTLLMVVLMLPVALVIAASHLVLQRLDRSHRFEERRVPFGALSLDLPAAFGPGAAREWHEWQVQEFRHPRLGYLRLATAPARGLTFAEAGRRWLHLPDGARGPRVYAADGATWFHRELPLFGPADYALRKRGKGIRFIAFLEREGSFHWISLDARNAAMPDKVGFDRMLLSLRTADGRAPEAGLAEALDRIPYESRFRFVQPLALLLLLPLGLGLLTFVVLGLVRRRSGRLPAAEGLLDPAPAFLEPHVEVGLFASLQRQFLDAAVAVTREGLTVFTHGTPFLHVPRSALKASLETGQAWLGPPYLDLPLGEGAEFRKWRFKHRTFKGGRLRIYTEDLSRLQGALLLQR